MNHQHRQPPRELPGTVTGTDTPAEPTDISHLPECEPGEQASPDAPFGLTEAGTPRQRPGRAGEGRKPTRWHPSILTYLRQGAQLGMTEQEIRRQLGVSRTLWHEWKFHPSRGKQFMDALRLDDMGSSVRAEQSLAVRANGATVWAERLDTKTGVVHRLRQQLPPDVEALKLLLSNRASERWKLKQEQGVSGLTVIINSPMIAQALGMTGQVVSVQPTPAVEDKTEGES